MEEINKDNYKNDIKEALKISLPIGIGYISVALAFGLLARSSDLTLLDTFLFSAILFAGASQFMAIELIVAGVPIIGVAISVFLLNLRLLVMATSLGVKTKDINKKTIPLLGFLLTDESFSILSFTNRKLTTAYSIIVEVVPYLFWVVFSVVGYLVGNILPQSLSMSLEIGLSAMFVALLLPSIKKNKIGKIISVLSSCIYGVIYFTNVVPVGWDIVLGILLSSLLGYILVRRKII